MPEISLLVIVGVVVLILLVVVALIVRQYHRVPPSQVMVVYGRREAKMISSGGVFILPVIETFKMLDITIMTIKQERDEVYTVSGVPIKLDWVAQVQTDPSEASLRTAARAFLDKSRAEIQQILSETLSANFRAIVGQMSVEAIHRDRDSFVQKVQDLARDDVAAMGVRIISMGIEEITDGQGYLTAMAAPQIAAVKRDATIAEAEAEREARVKAASARREAEQAELDATREILAQREALSIREVEVDKRVGLARATSEQEVQKLRALAVEQQQEAEVLVPARAKRQATEIEAEADRQRVTINADAQAQATRTRAQAEAQATEQKGRGEAAARLAMREADATGAKAEAEAVQARALAEAEGDKAKRLAEAEGEKAKLLAEAEGRREIAAASAAENEINLRQFLIEEVLRADVAKIQSMAQAMAGLGNNVRIVQFSGNGSNGHGESKNVLMDMLLNIPEVTEMFRAKVEALSGEDVETTMVRLAQLMSSVQTAAASTKDAVSKPETVIPPMNPQSPNTLPQ